MQKNVHVVPKDGNWAVRKESSKRVSKVTKTQKEAIQLGKEQAKRNGSELLIHGKNGRIREKNSYGNDPFPPKG
jgi:uncharacterized protein YdaT